MLDEDLAALYEVSAKRLNEQDGVTSRQSPVASQQPKAKTCLFGNHLIRHIHSVGKEESESAVNSQRQKPADLITNFNCRESVPGRLYF